jgi:hypothetical protein
VGWALPKRSIRATPLVVKPAHTLPCESRATPETSVEWNPRPSRYCTNEESTRLKMTIPPLVAHQIESPTHAILLIPLAFTNISQSPLAANAAAGASSEHTVIAINIRLTAHLPC